MPWDKGFNFRATSGFVTDGANETYVLQHSAGDAYPVTRNGVTFGWDGGNAASVQGRDRNAGIDRRLAGTAFIDTGGFDVGFRVDLPSAGSYNVRLAQGDDSGAAPYNDYLRLKDNTTVLDTFDRSHGTNGSFFDPTGQELSSSTWPGSNVLINRSFASTILHVQLGDLSTKLGFIAHLEVSEAGAAPVPFMTSVESRLRRRG